MTLLRRFRLAGKRCLPVLSFEQRPFRRLDACCHAGLGGMTCLLSRCFSLLLCELELFEPSLRFFGLSFQSLQGALCNLATLCHPSFIPELALEVEVLLLEPCCLAP